MKERANQITAANAEWRTQFRIRGSRRWPGVAVPELDVRPHYTLIK